MRKFGSSLLLHSASGILLWVNLAVGFAQKIRRLIIKLSEGSMKFQLESLDRFTLVKTFNKFAQEITRSENENFSKVENFLLKLSEEVLSKLSRERENG